MTKKTPFGPKIFLTTHPLVGPINFRTFPTQTSCHEVLKTLFWTKNRPVVPKNFLTTHPLLEPINFRTFSTQANKFFGHPYSTQ